MTKPEEFREKHLAWNFSAIVLDCATFAFGVAALDGSTMLPVLLAKLHASDALIGFSRFGAVIGYTVPALFAAHYVQGKALHKRFLLGTAVVARISFITLPFAILFFSLNNPALVVAWIFAVFGLFWVFDGACAMSWMDIIGKTIPERLRGRFFGVMQSGSGLLSVGSAFVVAAVLDNARFSFPRNFAILAAILFTGMFLSWLFLAAIREPDGVTRDDEVKPTLMEFVRETPEMLKRNPKVRRLIWIRLLLDGGGLAMPFYVLYAQRDLGVPVYMIGVYLAVKNTGRVLTGPLWGWISDRFGAGAGMLSLAFAVTSVPAIAIASHFVFGAALLIGFFVLGSVEDGLWMTYSTALLNTAQERDRPHAIGIATICLCPTALYGPIGGFIAQTTGYLAVFYTALACAGAGLVLALDTSQRNVGSGGTRRKVRFLRSGGA